MENNLQVKVNGILIAKLSVRRQIVEGYPDGPLELVITDPLLGKFAIDDNFIIEAKLGKKHWQKVTVKNLFAILTTIGVIS